MAVKLLALRAGRPSPPGNSLVLISVRGRVDPTATGRLEGLGQLKNPITSSGIEPATFRLVTYNSKVDVICAYAPMVLLENTRGYANTTRNSNTERSKKIQILTVIISKRDDAWFAGLPQFSVEVQST
jgi:hypothetical protein